MLHSKNEKAKGDYLVQARGTSALLVKEQIAQSISNFLGVVGSSEVFSPVLSMKSREILEAWARTQTLPKNLIPTEDEFDAFMKQQQEQAQQGGEDDPSIRVEQLRAEQLQAKQSHDKQMFEADKQAEYEQNNLDRQVKMAALREQRENRLSQEKQELMRLAQQDKLSQDKLMIELEKLNAKLKSDWEGKALEQELKARYGKTGNYGIE
jgi:hypothetical protein